MHLLLDYRLSSLGKLSTVQLASEPLRLGNDQTDLSSAILPISEVICAQSDSVIACGKPHWTANACLPRMLKLLLLPHWAHLMETPGREDHFTVTISCYGWKWVFGNPNYPNLYPLKLVI